MNSITRIASVIALGAALLAGSAGTALAAAQAVPPPSTNTSTVGPGPGAGGVLDPGTRTYRSGLYENGTGSQTCQIYTDAANDAIRAGNQTLADDIAGVANRKGCTIIEITS